MGRPGEKTVSNAVINIRRLCQLGGINLDSPMATLNRKTLTRVLDAACAAGLKAVTICSYMVSLQSVFARWTHPYYADLKWQIPVIELPSCNRHSPRYVRPDSVILTKVKTWYKSLENRQDRREWVAATLMLEFAMRNGDAGSLRWADFRAPSDGRTSGKRTARCISATRRTRPPSPPAAAYRGPSIPTFGPAYAYITMPEHPSTSGVAGRKTRPATLRSWFRAHRMFSTD